MSATTSGRKATTSDTDPKERLATTARQAADTVAGAAGEMAARLPEAANTTREAIGEANRAFQEANRIVKAGSDETLKVVGAASLGFAVGLLFGGANRFLVMAALVPAALVGSEFVQRQGSTTP
jgi:hypothetical protein